jgi:hypothetical protein
MMQTYMPALTPVISDALVFVVGMVVALRERKQHRA